MKQFNKLSILFLIILFAGCLATNANTETEKSVNVENLYSNSNCGSSQQEPSSTWIISQDQFDQTWQRLHSMRIGGNHPVVPPVDFTTHDVLLIQMGRKNSGGYRLELAETAGTVKNKTATVLIKWIEPEEGAFVTQALTNPCLLLKLEHGDYRTIRVKDQSGNQRITAEKP